MLEKVSKLVKPKPAGNLSLTSHNYRYYNISASDVLNRAIWTDHGIPHLGKLVGFSSALVFLVIYSSSTDAIVI